MGNLFSFLNYNKPGPGVNKEEPEKSKIIVFFQIYLRRFWDLIKVNLLFIFFNIPALLLVYFLFGLSYNTLQGFLKEGGTLFSFIAFAAFSALFLCVPVITTGPAQAGFTYVLRNYSRQEHAFIMSDFKEHTGKNFKQGFLISVIDFLILIFLLADIYISIKSGMNSIIVGLFVCFISLVLVLFLMMHFYIYPMLVTFNLSLKHIYKNALIFSIVKFFPNLGILFVCFVLSTILFLVLPVLAFVLFPLITVSTIGFITNFYAFPTLEKYMINRENPIDESNKEV